MHDGTYHLPIGPQHPMFPEPEYLKIKVDGETIVDVDINLGYMHKGIEGIMQKRNYIQNLYLVERVCGICGSSYQVVYSEAVERMLGLKIPERAKYIRTIIMELGRITSHLFWLGVAGNQIGLDTVFMYAWKDREPILEVLEQISGNRITFSMCTIGGVRRDIHPRILQKLPKILDNLEKRTKYYLNVFQKDRAILKRTRGIGILKKSDARKYSIVGPTTRASGVDYDIRKAEPYAAYDLINFKVITDINADVQARVVVRLKELIESSRIIKQCIKKMPNDGLKLDRVPLIVPAKETVSRVEAPRGELFFYVKSNNTEKPERVKIRPPTYANLLSLKPILAGQQLADMPILVSSIDPCFACCERVTLIDVNSGERKIVDEHYLMHLRDKK